MSPSKTSLIQSPALANQLLPETSGDGSNSDGERFYGLVYYPLLHGDDIKNSEKPQPAKKSVCSRSKTDSLGRLDLHNLDIESMTDENVSSLTFFGQHNNRRLLRKMDSNPQFSAVTSLPKLAKTNLLRRFLTKRFRREC
jgi:hypothetical protein